MHSKKNMLTCFFNMTALGKRRHAYRNVFVQRPRALRGTGLFNIVKQNIDCLIDCLNLQSSSIYAF